MLITYSQGAIYCWLSILIAYSQGAIYCWLSMLIAYSQGAIYCWLSMLIAYSRGARYCYWKPTKQPSCCLRPMGGYLSNRCWSVVAMCKASWGWVMANRAHLGRPMCTHPTHWRFIDTCSNIGTVLWEKWSMVRNPQCSTSPSHWAPGWRWWMVASRYSMETCGPICRYPSNIAVSVDEFIICHSYGTHEVFTPSFP